jgi:hypothetical protein
MIRPAPVELVFYIECVVPYTINAEGEWVMSKASLKEALGFVAEALPDKNRDKAEVLEQALQIVEEESGIQMVAKFVKLSPQCWATDRRSGYWTMLRTHFTVEEATELYLSQFPPALTVRQRLALKQSLMRRLGLSEIDSLRALERFQTRQSTYRRDPQTLHAYFA